MKRRGFGTGRGQGYLNLVPMDSLQHSLNAKGVKKAVVMPPQKLDPVSVLSGKGRRYDFGLIPTPQKKGMIREIAKKVQEKVDWAVQWEKEHLPKQKEWVKKEFEKAKELAKKGMDKVKDYAEKKKEDLDDVRDELDINDDGVQDISYDTLMDTNMQITQELNTIDLNKNGVPDHVEDGTFSMQPEMLTNQPVAEPEKKSVGFPFPTLNPVEEYSNADVTIQPTQVVVEQKGAGFPFPSVNPKADYGKEEKYEDYFPPEPKVVQQPKKTFGQKVKGTASAVGSYVGRTVKHEVQKRQLEHDMIRHLSDKELKVKALQVGKPMFGGLNAFEKEIIRRQQERERIRQIETGQVQESALTKSLSQSFGFLNPLATLSPKKDETATSRTKMTTPQGNTLDLGFLNPLSTFSSKKR